MDDATDSRCELLSGGSRIIVSNLLISSFRLVWLPGGIIGKKKKKEKRTRRDSVVDCTAIERS